MTLPTPQWLCFDLDGTLIDSVPDIANSVNHMLRELNLAPASEHQMRDWIGNGAAKLVERAVRYGKQQTAADDIQLALAEELFFSAYRKNMAKHMRIFPGAIDVLEYFQNRQVALACVTNKPREFTMPLLEQLSLHEYFQVCVCGDDTPNKKPAAEPVLAAIEALRGRPDGGYMIGDSQTDILAAVNAGTGAIYVSYGYNRGLSVDQYQPIKIDQLTQLIELFG